MSQELETICIPRMIKSLISCTYYDTAFNPSEIQNSIVHYQDIENVDILENTIDYDVHVKSNCVPVVGKMRVSITEGTSVDVVTEVLTEHDYIITDCMEVY